MGHLYPAGYDRGAGALAFPESFARLTNVLKPGIPLLLKVRVQIEEAGTRLSLQEPGKLETLAQPAQPTEYRVRLKLAQLTEEVDGSPRRALCEISRPQYGCF